MIALAVICFILAVIPAALAMRNLSLFRPLPAALEASGNFPRVSLLIPARDEAATISNAIGAALASTGVDLEVIVLDDHSTDDTAAIVRALAAKDSRLRLESAPSLPDGWCGKQHACHTLGMLGAGALLAWIDADVQLAPDTLARMAARLNQSDVALLSGFPYEITVTPMESLLIPLIHFVLLGYLPIDRMRQSSLPSLGAGCGQLFMAKRDAWIASGGHAAIKASLHDGIMLPRAFRRAGFATDIFDATDAARCRMYGSASAVWRGLLKNATEGMAAPTAIAPWTILLVGGQVAPIFLALANRDIPALAALGFAAWLISTAIRIVLSLRFRQPIWSALLHPIGIAFLVALQWQAWAMRVLKIQSTWRGRTYPARSAI